MRTLHVEQIENPTYNGTKEAEKYKFNYRVKRVTNAAGPPIGYVMNWDELADKCDDADWNVVTS